MASLERNARRTFQLSSAVAAVAALLLSHGRVSHAATLQWDADADGSNGAGGGAGTWDAGTTANWYDGTATTVVWPNTTGDVAIFGGTAGTVTIATGGVTANGLTFNTSGYTIAGDALTIGGTTPTITVTNLADLALISAAVNGSAGFTKAGAGTLTLSGTNAYTGTTAVNGGTLSIGADNNLGAAPGAATPGSLSLAGGTLATTASFSLSTNRGVALGAGGGTFDTASGTTLTYGGVIAGSTVLTKTGAGTLILSGTNTHSGGTAVNGGTLSVGADLNLGAAPGAATPGSLTLAGGTLATTASFTLATNRGVALGAGGGTISPASGTTLAYGGIMAGSTGLTKAGAGTLTLSGANTYSGGTTITAGTVSIGAENHLGAVASGVTLNGGTLSTTPFITTRVHTIGASGGTLNLTTGQYRINVANGLVGSGPLTVNGTYTDAATGNGNLRLSLANSYSGQITLQGASLEFEVAGAVAPGATFIVNNPSELVAQGSSAVALPNAITVNGGTLGFENGNLGNFSGPITVGGAAGTTGIKVGLRDWYSANFTPRSGTISGNLTGAANLVTLPTGNATLAAATNLTLSGNNTAFTGNYTAGASTNILFTTLNSRGGATGGSVTVNTDTTRIGGVGFGYDFGATLPTITNARTGSPTPTTGGVFGVNTTLPNTTTLNMATLGGGGMFLGSQVTGTYSATTLGADGTNYRLGGGLGNLTLSGTNVLTGGTNVVVGDTRVNGTGTVTLSAANDYTGTTTINGGSTLVVSHGDALGSTATNTVTNGGALSLTGGITVNEPLSITAVSATASTTNLINGLVNLSGTNTYAGNITANINTANNARVSVTAGTLNLSGNVNIAVSGTGTTANGFVFSGGGAINQTGTSVISGTGAVFSVSSGTVTVLGNNTYTGRTQIQNGTYRTPSLNSVVGGTASSGLGAPTSAANGVIELGATTTSGTLVYTGTGETTDRSVNLIGTTGGGTIDQSGTGLLKFTTSMAAATTGGGAKTFTLQGSTTGTGEFAGAIVNNSAANTTAVTKTGTGTWTLSGANTYSGATNVTGGVLVASSLNSVAGGTASSSLGAPTTVATGTIGIGTGTTGATLRYSGTTATTDRVINLAGSTGGATIDLTGSGTLTFSSAPTATGGGIKTLTLTGIAGTTGQFNGAIPNNSATNTTAVTKNGLGTWVLGGANSYTGATTINTGVLRVTGSTTATSAVAVNANAFLGGSGTVNGAVTVAAGGGIDLRDGAVGNLTLGSTLTLNGSTAVPGNLYFDLGSTTVDTMAVTGVITAGTAGGTLVSFNQLAGTPLTDGTYNLITSSATAASTGFALATTRSGGHTYSLLTSTTSPILRVTVGTAATGAAGAFWSGATSAAWTTAGNWNTDATSNTALGSIPGVGTNVTFSTTTPAASNLSTTLGADFQINSLTFASTQTAAVSIGAVANTLTIDALAVNGNTLGNGISQLAAATHTISSKVGIAGTQTWTVASGGGLTVSGPVLDIGGSFKLTKAGAGTLTLSNAASTSTFTGDIDVTAGVLAFAGNNGANGDPLALGAGNKTITVTNNAVVRPTSSANPTSTNTKAFVVGAGGGTFDVPTGVTFSLDDAGQFSGTGDLTVTGAGVVQISAQTFPFSGNVNVTSGTLRLSTGTPLGTTAGRTLAVSGTGALDFTGTTAVVPLGVTLNGTGLSNGGALISSGTGSTSANFTLLGDSSAGGSGALTVNGNIGGAFRLTKVGAGTTTLAGTNTYGNTTVSAGTLVAAKTASLPNYATAGAVSVASGATLAFNVGGTGEFAAADITNALASGAFANGSGIGFDTTNAAGGTFTAPAVTPTPAVAALNLTKLGTNTLALGSANGFGTGATTILNGTVSVTAATDNALGTGALTLGASAGTTTVSLDLGTTSQTVGALTVPTNTATANTIAIGAGKTLTATGAVTVGVSGTGTTNTRLNVTGATGTFSIGTAATPTNQNFQLGAGTTTNISNGAILDMSGLGTFYANLGTGTFRVGDPTNVGGTGTAGSTLTLAPTSTILATTITSDSPAGNQTQAIKLGTVSNTLQANTIEIGGTSANRSNGTLDFQTAAGSLTVRNLAGTGRAALNVAYGATATGFAVTSTVDLTGHPSDLLLSTLRIGGRTGTTAGAATGTFSFNNGTLDVTGITVGNRATTSGTAIATSTANLNLGGGTTTVGTGGIVVANNASTLAGANDVVGTVTVSGGTVTVGATGGTSITLGTPAASGAGATTATLNVSGGSLALAGNLIRGTNAGTITSTVNLTGGTLNMQGNAIGTAGATVTAAFQTGVLQSLGQLNGGTTPLAKSVAGTLTLTGTSTYTGATNITAGTLLVGNATTAGSIGNTAVTVGDGATANSGVLGGTGTIGNTGGKLVTVANGGTIAPGASIGKLTTGDETWAGGGTYRWEIGNGLNFVNTANATTSDPGTPGTDWDLIDLGSASLGVTASNASPFTISINSSGVSTIDENGGQVWFTIAKSSSGGASFLAAFASLDPNAFVLPDDNVDVPDWEIRAISDGGTGFLLQAGPTAVVPEPASLSMFGLAAAGLLARRRRRQATCAAN